MVMPLAHVTPARVWTVRKSGDIRRRLRVIIYDRLQCRLAAYRAVGRFQAEMKRLEAVSGHLLDDIGVCREEP